MIAGDAQPPVVHAIAHAMNDLLGNNGRTVEQTEPVEASPIDDMKSLGELVADMERGQVELLVILGGNPAFTAPRDLPFGQQLSRVPFRVHLGMYEDETVSALRLACARGALPRSLGRCSRVRRNGHVLQPLIAPLYGGNVNLRAAGHGCRRRSIEQSHDIVRDYWRRHTPAESFDERWQRALNDGVLADTALPARSNRSRLRWPPC